MSSETVRRTCATMNWYRFPMNKARYLVLVTIMSNYRTKITAAKVVDVSLATFMDVSTEQFEFCTFEFCVTY
ncbi:hypothetical protein K0M31_017730 [Melipona bicolor]|uniref:Uncharacterized protein n=1 Tax=Melipona bicolor TaxID=60889 RepID=A0AA40G5F1_9HYME|nr:hypothetical protein K0M31_017730 [Melipona bicolor]